MTLRNGRGHIAEVISAVEALIMGVAFCVTRSKALNNTDSERIMYKKDYSNRTAEEWLELRKWTGFLLRVPLGRERTYIIRSANDMMAIRVTATQLSKRPNCDRTFVVKLDLETKKLKITAKPKNNDQIIAD